MMCFMFYDELNWIYDNSKFACVDVINFTFLKLNCETISTFTQIYMAIQNQMRSHAWRSRNKSFNRNLDARINASKSLQFVDGFSIFRFYFDYNEKRWNRFFNKIENFFPIELHLASESRLNLYVNVVNVVHVLFRKWQCLFASDSLLFVIN